MVLSESKGESRKNNGPHDVRVGRGAKNAPDKLAVTLFVDERGNGHRTKVPSLHVI